jgi:hypothetical protein
VGAQILRGNLVGHRNARTVGRMSFVNRIEVELMVASNLAGKAVTAAQLGVAPQLGGYVGRVSTAPICSMSGDARAP